MKPDSNSETLQRALAAGAVRLATVIEVADGGNVGVVVPGDPPQRLHCLVLRTGDQPRLTLALGARVLVLPPAADSPAVILGVVGAYQAPRPEAPHEPPARVEVVAQQELSLTCGEASIALHADGRVVVKGKDILSRAKRTQRIRGGSVQIN